MLWDGLRIRRRSRLTGQPGCLGWRWKLQIDSAGEVGDIWRPSPKPTIRHEGKESGQTPSAPTEVGEGNGTKIVSCQNRTFGGEVRGWRGGGRLKSSLRGVLPVRRTQLIPLDQLDFIFRQTVQLIYQGVNLGVGGFDLALSQTFRRDFLLHNN